METPEEFLDRLAARKADAKPILLWGPMGVGKTTIGARLAEALGRPFVDLDAEIEGTMGDRIAEVFARGEEQSFRTIEQLLLGELLRTSDAKVVALGGGALVDPDLAARALRSALVVTLRASEATLWSRASHGSRPLLASDDGRAALEKILKERARAYAIGHLFVDSEGTVDEVLARITEALARPIASVATPSQVSTIHFPEDAAGALENILAGLKASSVFLVVDRDVESALAPLLAHGVFARHPRLVIEPGEAQKTLASIAKLGLSLSEQGADRGTVLVGLGGGVVTDMTGFLASMYMRGIRWIAVPTTLVGMVDAAIGGKTGVDLSSGKNLLGAFHQPEAVLISASLLATLPPAERRAGLAELLKTLAIGHKPSFLLDLPAILRSPDPNAIAPLIVRAARIKADLVTRDPFETKRLRTFLNFGHTLAHALEAHAGYEGLRHGEAVSIGMAYACHVGERLGVTSPVVSQMFTDLLDLLRLPNRVSRDELEAALTFVGRDKKSLSGTIDFVALRDFGAPEIVPLPVGELSRLYLESWDGREQYEAKRRKREAAH